MFLAPAGAIRGANRSLTRLLHLPLEGTLGRSVLDLVVPADRERVMAEVNALSVTGGTVHFAATFATGRGGELPLSVTVVDLLADRPLQSFVVAASDMDRKSVEEGRCVSVRFDLCGYGVMTK